MELKEYKRLLKEDDALIECLMDKSEETKWFYERFLYFTECVSGGCQYAESCIKLMKEDIDEFYTGRSTSNTA